MRHTRRSRNKDVLPGFEQIRCFRANLFVWQAFAKAEDKVGLTHLPRFFSTFDMGQFKRKSFCTTAKSALKLVNLPRLKVIRPKRATI